MKYVGCQHIRVWDHQANIGFPVFVMYPAADAHGTYDLPPFTVTAGLNAAVAAGQFPVVTISHGSGGNRLGYLMLAQALAEAGYVVLMPEHFGNNTDDNFLSGKTRNLELRPRHISLCIDDIARNEILAGAVLTDQVAVIGHSMGGYAALAVAGGQVWNAAKRKVAVGRDDRVKGLVLMAPATAWFTPDASLANVVVPMLIYQAGHDAFTPPDHTARVLNQVPGRTQITHHLVENAGHFSFLSPFPEALIHPDFPPSQDPAGFDRTAFQQRLAGEVIAFLEGVL
ncbi:MAG: alpha/beta hydrolase [Marinosulfonomonas sp.]|nr:MAG: alpha/beta hydrolase [Marinosulfonomonas sp.]